MKNPLLLIVASFAMLLSANSFGQTNTFPSSGNVGIGTLSPSSLLHIYGTSNSNTNGLVRVINTYSNTYVPAMELLAPNLTNNQLVYFAFGQDASNYNRAALSFKRVGNNSSSNYMSFGFYGADNLFNVQANGNVGIGTTTPSALLDVNGSAHFSGTTYLQGSLNYINQGISDINNTNAQLNFPGDGSVGISTGASTATRQFTILNNGNMGLGTTAPSEKLAVNGNILSKKVRVTQTGWSDYVFYKDYKLLPLTEVESYIKQHQHLPDIPSAKEVSKNGIDLGDSQAALLKKIEELTLYVIDLKKQVDRQNKKIQQLQKRK